MLISNNNYARHANYVFAETIDPSTFSLLDKNSLFITESNQEAITYKSTILKISDGDSVFCRSDYLDELFYLVKKTSINNLKLITHQTDLDISRKLEKRLPRNFISWCGINKNTQSDKVISIPIGLAGNFSNKNLQVKDFEKHDIKNFDLSAKEVKIYMNFQKNTNNLERQLAIDILESSNKTFISEPNLSKLEYKEHLARFAFILCPWGNGYDTHRIWEALYSGSIPIVKNHSSFEYLKDLPVLIINDYQDLHEIDLDLFIKKFDIKDFNFDKLFIDYWISKINDEESSNIKKVINIKYSITLFFHIKMKINNKFNSTKKKIAYYLKKIYIKVANLNRN